MVETPQQLSVTTEPRKSQRVQSAQTPKASVAPQDPLCEAYQKLLESDLQKTNLQNQLSEIQHKKAQEQKQSQALKTQKDLKLVLENQISDRNHCSALNEIDERIHFYRTSQKFAADPTLQLLHPKMHATPDYEKVKQVRKQQKLTARNLEEQMQQRQNEEQANQQKFREEYNAQCKVFCDSAEKREQKEKVQRQSLIENLVKVQKEQMVAKEFQEVLAEDTKLLENMIQYGGLKDDSKPKYQPDLDANEPQKDRILKLQRHHAEKRARLHVLNPTRPYQYAFVEMEHMPELPQGHVLWGSPALPSQWATSYSTNFVDPQVELERHKKACADVKDGKIEEAILDQIEEKLQSPTKSIDLNEQDIEQKCEEDNVSQNNDYKQLEESPRIDQVTQITSRKLNYSVTAKSTRSKKSFFSVVSKLTNPFETKSQTVKNLADFTSVRESNDLKNTYKRVLEEPQPSHSNHFNEDAASAIIKKRICDAVYKRLPKAANDIQLNAAQLKAQQDAFSRLVQKAENQTVNDKRIAEERRRRNQQHDLYEKNLKDLKECREHALEADVLNQVKDKQKKQMLQTFYDRNSPHIKGDQGYPPHYVKSHEQAKMEAAAQSRYLTKNLRKQINSRLQTELEQKNQQDIKDQEYLQEFKIVQKQCDIIHTGGNVGKIGSISQEHIDTLKQNANRLPDNWSKNVRLKEVQSQVCHKTGMLITSDKVQGLLKQINSELKGLYTQNPNIKIETKLPKSYSKRLESGLPQMSSNMLPKEPPSVQLEAVPPKDSAAKNDQTNDNILILQKMAKKMEQPSNCLRASTSRHQTQQDTDAESLWARQAFQMAEQEKHEQLAMIQAMERKKKNVSQKSVNEVLKRTRTGAESLGVFDSFNLNKTMSFKKEKKENILQYPWEIRREAKTANKKTKSVKSYEVC